MNHSCTCGPYLDAGRVADLPVQFGPGSLNRVVRESVQALVDVASDPQSVAQMLPKGSGKVIIKGKPRALGSIARFRDLPSSGNAAKGRLGAVDA